MTNERIRRALFDTGMRQYELADLLNISEYTLIRRLRKELPEKDQAEIVDLIREHCRGDRHADA